MNRYKQADLKRLSGLIDDTKRHGKGFSTRKLLRHYDTAESIVDNYVQHAAHDYGTFSYFFHNDDIDHPNNFSSGSACKAVASFMDANSHLKKFIKHHHLHDNWIYIYHGNYVSPMTWYDLVWILKAAYIDLKGCNYRKDIIA